MKKHHTQKSTGRAADLQARVLLATEPNELESAYDEWAESYDKDLQELSGTGENEPGLAASRVLINSVIDVKDTTLRLLDFGAGTGAAGAFLQSQGLDTKTQLDGCDLSQGMLDIAAKRNCYRRLIKADFTSSNCSTTTSTDHEGGQYDIIHASGVFAPGQAPPSAFDEFLQLLKPGGHAVFTIRVGYYDSDEGAAHRTHLEQLVAQRKWTIVAKPQVPYLPSDGVDAYVFVMKKT